MVVPSDDAMDRAWLSRRDDAALIHRMMRRHLRCDFGYAYPLAGVDTRSIEQTHN